MTADTTPPTEELTSGRAVDLVARKRRIVRWMLAYSAFLGVVSGLLPERDSSTDMLVGLPLLVLSVAWCFTDAEERGFQLSGFLRVLLVLLFFVGFPLYAFRSRGLGGFRLFAWTLLLFGAMAACVCVTLALTLLSSDAIGR